MEFYQKKGIVANNFKFSLVRESKVLELLNDLNVYKSTGQDDISARFLKDRAKSIVTPLTYIINLSLTSAEVPDDFKLARVVPLYKKGNCNYEGNYRPVFILPVASKLLERIT